MHFSPLLVQTAGFQKDLVSRLRNVANLLRQDKNVEADSPDYPGLAAMAACLVEKWLGHKDKEVRLYTVLCCMELFEVVRLYDCSLSIALFFLLSLANFHHRKPCISPAIARFV